MNILSLYDGISGAMVAIQRAGIVIDNYYASEIDKYAEAVSKYHFSNVIRLGDVTKILGKDLPNIDLLIGGSPCTGFSRAGKGLNFNDPQSKLFFEYVRLLKECKPTYFLLENVKMKKEWRDIISEYVGVDCIEINSSLVSAQHRTRLYWVNIPIEEPEDRRIMLKDIVLSDVMPVALHNLYGGFKEKSVKVFEGKSPTIRTSVGGGHIPSFVKKNNPQVVTFTERRTEEGKRIRKEYQKQGKDFCPRREKEVVPRFDEKANCITATATIEHLVLTDKALKYMDRKVTDGRTHWDFKHHSDITDKKSATVVANFFKGVPYNVFKDWDCIRRFAVIETERLQTLPDNYTQYGIFDNQVKEISNTQRYKMIGNGFTIDVISHILKNIKDFKEKEK